MSTLAGATIITFIEGLCGGSNLVYTKLVAALVGDEGDITV